MIPVSKPLIGEEEIEAVSAVLRSGIIAQGPQVEAFENTFAEVCGVKESVALNSGTAALHTALKVAGVGPGDEVITTPFTFIATGNSILMQQAIPVFCDIELDTFTIDALKVEQLITDKTKAIIAVDLYGQLANYEVLEPLCKKHNIALIEDAAQSVGATLGDRHSGSFGDVATFSFYATKNIAAGEAGAITTSNSDYAHQAKLFRQHGRKDLVGYEYSGLGYNYRTTDIAAALLNEQLKKLDAFTTIRQDTAALYLDKLKGIPGVVLPTVKYGNSVFHQFTLRITEASKLSRKEFQAALQEKGIGSAIYYPEPLHYCDQFKTLGFNKGDFPHSEQAAEQVVSIPVHAGLTSEEKELIIQTIRDLYD